MRLPVNDGAAGPGTALNCAIGGSAAIISDSRLYGTIGVVFTLLTWFIAIGAVIVLGAAAGAAWDQRKGCPDPVAGGLRVSVCR